jgi:hypothetical protein
MIEQIGFTATRDGLTGPQLVALSEVLASLPPYSEGHHGDAIGGDAAIHRMLKAMGWRIVIHPAYASRHRAFMQDADEKRRPKRPLDRNIDIVQETSRLIACPGGIGEEIRSGTWQTIRTARRLHKPITLVWPDGRAEPDSWQENA